MSKKSNYWLFQIMYDFYPLDYWRKMVESGLAAQHYPLGWSHEAHNIAKLNQLRKGDWIVAAFRNRRFAGYGRLKSDFYRSNISLNIRRHGDRKSYEFGERFLCKWRVIPFDKHPFVDCKDLKHKKNVDREIILSRGFCVKKISEKTFDLLKSHLDHYGAKEVSVTNPILETDSLIGEIVRRDLIGQDYFEGKRFSQYSVKYERDPNLRKTAIMIHGTKCKVCGFDFSKIYGDHGKGYIEVHHLKPRSKLGKNVKVDPQKHMTVVCSNCHRMIHRKKEKILSIEQIKRFTSKSR